MIASDLFLFSYPFAVSVFQASPFLGGLLPRRFCTPTRGTRQACGPGNTLVILKCPSRPVFNPPPCFPYLCFPTLLLNGPGICVSWLLPWTQPLISPSPSVQCLCLGSQAHVVLMVTRFSYLIIVHLLKWEELWVNPSDKDPHSVKTVSIHVKGLEFLCSTSSF
jgi:hypothetical protein